MRHHLFLRFNKFDLEKELWSRPQPIPRDWYSIRYTFYFPSRLTKSRVDYLLAQVLLLRELIGNREHNVTPPVKLTDYPFFGKFTDSVNLSFTVI